MVLTAAQSSSAATGSTVVTAPAEVFGWHDHVCEALDA